MKLNIFADGNQVIEVHFKSLLRLNETTFEWNNDKLTIY